MFAHVTKERNPKLQQPSSLHQTWTDPDYLAWRAALPADPTPEQVEELAEQGLYFMPEWPDPNGNGPWFDAHVELEEIFPSGTPLTDAWSTHQSDLAKLPF